MSNYQSYSAHQAPANEVAPTLRPRIDPNAGQTSSVVIRNGVTIVQTSGSERATSEELNPSHNSGTIFETARSVSGAGVSEIKGDTLLTIDGVQAPASFWEKEGVIHRGANGSYAEGQGEAKGSTEGESQSDPAETPQASTNDDLSMPPECVFRRT